MNNLRSTITTEDRTANSNAADEPPFSRLFVLTPRAATEDQIRRCFAKFGHVQDVWLVKDRQTGENRGICYIKYEKASEAALAVENLNGNLIDGHSRPLKVLISNNRRDGSGRDPCEAERMLRLFVLVPKTNFTNVDLRKAFEPFGDIESVQLVTDRNTGENRGFGYVKFKKASEAAKALEECDSSFKPKFAEPLKSRRSIIEDSETSTTPQTIYGPSNPKRNRHSRPSSSVWSDSSVANDKPINCQQQQSTINAAHVVVSRCHKAISANFLQRLFDLIPGMINFRVWPFVCDDRTSASLIATHHALTNALNRFPPLFEHQQRYFVRYSDEDMANYARHKLNGFEYPGGYTVHIDAWANGPDVKIEQSFSSVRQLNNTNNNHPINNLRSPSTPLKHKPISAPVFEATAMSCPLSQQQQAPQPISQPTPTPPPPPPLLTNFVPPGLATPMLHVSAPAAFEKSFYGHHQQQPDSFLSPRPMDQSPVHFDKVSQYSAGQLSPSLQPQLIPSQIEEFHENVFLNSSFAGPQATPSRNCGGYIVRYDKIEEISNACRRRLYHHHHQLEIDTELEDTGFCSVHLPPEKPMSTEEFNVLKVIRISASVSIPTDVLRNVFCRFGHLIDANMNGRVFGYILYGSVQSANWAIRMMNGEQIAGIRIFLTDIANDGRQIMDFHQQQQQQQNELPCPINN